MYDSNMIVSMYNTPTYHTGYTFCLSQDCTLSLEWIEEMNEEQQYHVRRGLEAFIGEEAHPTIEMVAEEGARLAAHELGLDAPPCATRYT